MKISQSNIIALQVCLAPPLRLRLRLTSPLTKLRDSYNFSCISIPSRQIKPICFCTYDEENQPESGIYDVVSGINNNNNNGGFYINIEKVGKRGRKIEASVVININNGFEIVWGLLTDYERLSDFIPGLAVSRLIQQSHNYARLFQIGQQNLPMGLKFNAKAVLDCYEKDLQVFGSCQRRDIEFKMVEGDFDIFEGKWSVQEYDAEECNDEQIANLMEGNELGTILSYVVEVKPKPWLPVGLVEDRLCKEIKTNLCCVRDEAHLRLESSCS